MREHSKASDREVILDYFKQKEMSPEGLRLASGLKRSELEFLYKNWIRAEAEQKFNISGLESLNKYLGVIQTLAELKDKEIDEVESVVFARGTGIQVKLGDVFLGRIADPLPIELAAFLLVLNDDSNPSRLIVDSLKYGGIFNYFRRRYESNRSIYSDLIYFYSEHKGIGMEDQWGEASEKCLAVMGLAYRLRQQVTVSDLPSVFKIYSLDDLLFEGCIKFDKL